MARDLGLITTPTTPTLERPEKTPVKPGAFGGAPSNSFGPDAAANVAKSAADFFTGGTQAVGKDITAALPGSVTGVDQLNKTNEDVAKSDIDYIKAIQKKKQAGEKITPAQQQIYDNILKGHAKTTAADLTPAVNKSNAEVVGDFARMGGEVLGEASFAKPGMVTGALTKPLFATAPGAVTVAKGAVDLASQGIEKAVATNAERAATKATDKIIDMVSPRLTPSVAESTKATNPTGFLGKISAVTSERTKQVADAVRLVVNPAKTFTENANVVEHSIGQEAEALKAAVKGANHPYTYKELVSNLNKIDIPEFIKTSDSVVQNRAQRIINKFAEIAKTHGGTISGLLDARKEFDVWVKKEYPRVFDESGNAVNTLVKNVRTATHDFMAKNVPSVAFKESLKKQNLMYDALDILREKAAKGAPKSAGEIGTTNIQRFAQRHPTLKKRLGEVVSLGLGAAGIAKAADVVSNH